MEKIHTSIIKKTASGFSLMELMVIIILIGIFAAMAMTRTSSGLTTIQEQIAIDQITSDIDFAKSMAFARHDTITLVFSTSQESYTVFNGPDDDRSWWMISQTAKTDWSPWIIVNYGIWIFNL